MESSGRFERLFFKMLKEENTAGADGAFGDGPSVSGIYDPPGGTITSNDKSYAPENAKNPTPVGKVQTRKGTAGSKKKKKKKKVYLPGENEEDTHPGYEDTTWSNGGTTITMQDVENKLTELKAPVISIPVKNITHLDIHTRHKPNKTPEQVKSTYDRAMKADLKYPIIITKYNGNYDMILDGNHRLHKAVEIGEDTIQAKVLDLSKTPEWLSVFGEDEEDVHKPVKPGILKKRLGELSCSKVRGAKGKLKDKGTHYAKALQRYLNYHC